MDRLEKAKQELEKATEEFLFASREAGADKQTSLREIKTLIAETAEALPA
jgi:hypothetical protein